MRWMSFILFAGLLLTLQSALASRMEVFGCRPDWLLVVAVFLGMHARGADAALAAWLLGAGADLMTIERFGLLAMSYALVAIGVACVKDFLFRHFARTQVIITFVACLLVSVCWLVYRYTLYDYSDSFLKEFTVRTIPTAVYTALWAPIVHKLLLPMSSVFGIQRPRYLHAGLHRLGRGNV